MAQPFFGLRRIVITAAATGLALLTLSVTGPAVAVAQAEAEAPPAPPEPYGPPPGVVAVPGQQQTAPVPPAVEEPPVAVQGGGYCFGGPHPADGDASAGQTWDATPGRHIHNYPPMDLRLFAVQDGCYYFIGDPADFGYQGETFAYYGAHPVHASYGGGWCFMIGAHHHWWRPWSPYFVVAGPWYYWQGPYDPFFWNYWPYYAFYYHHHYPRFYAGGRYYVGGRGHYANGAWRGRAVAPAIGRVSAPAVRPTAPIPAGRPQAFGARPTQGFPAQAGPSHWSGTGNAGRSYFPQAQPIRPAFGRPTAAPTFNGGSNWGRAAPMVGAPVRSAPSGGGSFFRSAPASSAPSFRGGGGGGGTTHFGHHR